MSFAFQYGVPRSTARSWLAARTIVVVTADALNMDAAQLQQEVLRLRTRVHKLIALLRVLLTASKGVDYGVPTVLADGGTENFNTPVEELIHSGLLHRVLAGTEITYSNSMIESWWRVLKHQWLCLNALDTVRSVEKLVRFYVQEHNSRLPHAAFRGQTPDEMYFKTEDSIPEELEAARQRARQARAEANRQLDCEACELLAASRN